MDEILKLRQAVARALKIKICGVEAGEAKPTTQQFTAFFKDELKAFGNAAGTNKSVFGYSRKSAESALEAILFAQPYWDANINKTKANFEIGLTNYINTEGFAGVDRIPPRFFRKGFTGQIACYADPLMLTEKRDAEFIVSQLFDLCKAGGGELDSNALRGLFIVAAIGIEHSDEPFATSSVTFADLFDENIVLDQAAINFGECHVASITRVNPAGKPIISAADYNSHIYHAYDWTDSGADPQAAKRELLEKCIRLMVKTTQKYLIPLERMLDRTIGCGKLPRVMLDVENGVILARRVDQGKLWIVGISSIERHVDECDKLFDKSIAGSYIQALKVARP